MDRREVTYDVESVALALVHPLFGHSFIRLALLDPLGNVLAINRSAQSAIGVSERDLIGRPLWEAPWLAHLKDEVREEVLRACGGETGCGEYELRNPNGQTSLMRGLVRPILDADGDVIYIIAEGVDVTEQRHAESDAERRAAELERVNAALERKSVALEEVLATIKCQKREATEAVGRQIDEIVLPALSALRSELRPHQQRQVDLIVEYLQEITAPFLDVLFRSLATLSPAERRLCQWIRQGLANKEIAQLASLSTDTVRTHRRNIRRKLGISNSSIDLSTHLNKLMDGAE